MFEDVKQNLKRECSNKYINSLKGKCKYCNKHDFLIAKMCGDCYKLELVFNKVKTEWKIIKC